MDADQKAAALPPASLDRDRRGQIIELVNEAELQRPGAARNRPLEVSGHIIRAGKRLVAPRARIRGAGPSVLQLRGKEFVVAGDQLSFTDVILDMGVGAAIIRFAELGRGRYRLLARATDIEVQLRNILAAVDRIICCDKV